jgi:transcriptional regulator with XRE-family HTH domain
MPKSPFTHGPSAIHQRETVRSEIATEKQRIGRCLRAHRLERGWTRERAAAHIGIHPVHLAKIERGEANVTISTLTAVAVAYELSTRNFFSSPPRECA